MTRFFATTHSSGSDTDYDSEYDSEHSEHSTDYETSVQTVSGKSGVGKYITGAVSYKASASISKSLLSSDDEDSDGEPRGKRTVKSGKHKFDEKCKGLLSSVCISVSKNDWKNVLKNFEAFKVHVKKYKFDNKVDVTSSVLKDLGLSEAFVPYVGVPVQFIEALVVIEDVVADISESKESKKFKSSDMKAFASMKQKTREYLETFREDILYFRGTREVKEEPVEEDKVTADMPEEIEVLDGVASSEYDSYSDVSSSSSNEMDFSDSEKIVVKSAANKWMRKDIGVLKQTVKPKQQRSQKAKAIEKEEKLAVEPVILSEDIINVLVDIMSIRGKKNTDKADQVYRLEDLLKHATHPRHRIRVLFCLVTSQFDVCSNSGISNTHMLKRIEENIRLILDIFEETSIYDLIIETNRSNYHKNVNIGINHEFGNKEKSLEVFLSYVHGCMHTEIGRLDDEFNKSFLSMDPHSVEYVERLGDEIEIYIILVRANLHYTRALSYVPMSLRNILLGFKSQFILRRLEHIYYKPDDVIAFFEGEIPERYKKEERQEEFVSEENLENISKNHHFLFEMDKYEKEVLSSPASRIIYGIACYLYQNGNDRVRTRAILAHMYNHSLNNRFCLSRDLLLMTHLQDTISHSDMSTQHMYNRALVQMGLSAFKSGKMREALMAFQDILSSGRQKDLLAQSTWGFRYGQDRPDNERLDKNRQLPFHMHINLEFLDAAYLVASLLVEIPSYVSYSCGLGPCGDQSRGRKSLYFTNINRHMRRLMEMNERLPYHGPPEATRDNIIASVSSFVRGDWKTADRHITSMSIWSVYGDSDSLRDILKQRIKEECLKMYLIWHQRSFISIRIGHLAKMFELSESEIRRCVYEWMNSDNIGWIWLDEYPLSGNEDAGYLYFDSRIRETLTSRTYAQAVQMAERLGTLFEEAEKTADDVCARKKGHGILSREQLHS